MSTGVTIFPALPAPSRPTRPWWRVAVLAGRALAVVVVSLLATGAGIGWLYVLRHTGVLNVGPSVHEALALQRLAGDASQPVGRIAVAWLPTGVAAGLALRAAGLRRRAPRAGVLFAALALLLLAAGAGADSVTASEPLRLHLAAQPGRAAIWLAAAFAAVGAALPSGRERA